MTGKVVPLAQVRGDATWAKWHELANFAPPFLSPEFFALAEPLAGGGEVLIAEALRDGALIGTLPLRLSGRTLEALRCDHTPSFDYCGSADGVDASWQALLADERWDLLVLKNVPVASVLAQRLPALAGAAGCPMVTLEGARHLFIRLPELERRLSPKFMTNLRRVERKAGGVELERLTQPKRADFEQALAIEAVAWKGSAGTSISSDPGAAHFYAALTRLFGRRERAAISFLRVADRRVAVLLSIEDSNTLYALKIGYDPEAAALSPGHMLVWKVASDAERRGLRELDFVGREDAWKRKWTDDVKEHVSLVVYRRSPRGLALWASRELLKPLALRTLRDLEHPLASGCQRDDVIGKHTLLASARGRLDRGLGLKTRLGSALDRPAPADSLGAESAFPVGSWVRVRDAAEIRATLSPEGKLRGLWFVPRQWQSPGRVYRVAGHVRRIRVDHGLERNVSRTVLLEGMDCTGDEPVPAGCGRHCPLWFRDEWLTPAEAPRREPPAASELRHVRVRETEEIRASLDLFGRRDGLSFMPEMGDHAGKRFHALTCVSQVFEWDRWATVRAPIWILEGLQCSGRAAKGHCDRRCALLWHADWLIFDKQGGDS